MTEPAKSPALTNAEFLSRAIAAWRKAQVVHQSPSWNGQPEARALAEEAALHHEYEPLLSDLLADTNQLVVAYALITLELMGSDRLADLPESLLANRSNLTIHSGSIRNGTDLGGFARQIHKRAKSASAARVES